MNDELVRIFTEKEFSKLLL